MGEGSTAQALRSVCGSIQSITKESDRRAFVPSRSFLTVGSGTGSHLEGDRHGSQPAVELALQGKRAGSQLVVQELLQLLVVASAGGQDPLQWRGRAVIYLSSPLAGRFSANQLHHRLKAVGKGAQELRVELVQPSQLLQAVQTLIADPARNPKVSRWARNSQASPAETTKKF